MLMLTRYKYLDNCEHCILTSVPQKKRIGSVPCFIEKKGNRSKFCINTKAKE